MLIFYSNDVINQSLILHYIKGICLLLILTTKQHSGYQHLDNKYLYLERVVKQLKAIRSIKRQMFIIFLGHIWSSKDMGKRTAETGQP